jgi:hypothetical protein
LIFDDTVINKKYGDNVELTRRQYSGNENKVICVPQSYEVRGVGIVNSTGLTQYRYMWCQKLLFSRYCHYT